MASLYTCEVNLIEYLQSLLQLAEPVEIRDTKDAASTGHF